MLPTPPPYSQTYKHVIKGSEQVSWVFGDFWINTAWKEKVKPFIKGKKLAQLT